MRNIALTDKQREYIETILPNSPRKRQLKNILKHDEYSSKDARYLNQFAFIHSWGTKYEKK